MLINDVLPSFFSKLFWPDFYTLDHHNQIVPGDKKRSGVLIKTGKVKPSGFKLFVINYQAGIFHVQDFHDCLALVYKYKHITASHIPLHERSYNAAKGIKALAHVNRSRIQIIIQRFMQVEHIISQISG
jgi:hypothetical protein